MTIKYGDGNGYGDRICMTVKDKYGAGSGSGNGSGNGYG